MKLNFIYTTYINAFNPLTQVERARVGLQAFLLVRSVETGELVVNFDQELQTQIRETSCMTKMNLEIPPFAALLQQMQHTFKKNYGKLQVGHIHVHRSDKGSRELRSVFTKIKVHIFSTGWKLKQTVVQITVFLL